MPGHRIPHAYKSVVIDRDSVDLDSVAGKSTASDLDCFHNVLFEFRAIFFDETRVREAETHGEKNLQKSFFGDKEGKGSVLPGGGPDGRKSERKHKQNRKKMLMLQDGKQGAVIPPTNQSPDFNVKVAYKM